MWDSFRQNCRHTRCTYGAPDIHNSCRYLEHISDITQSKETAFMNYICLINNTAIKQLILNKSDMNDTRDSSHRMHSCTHARMHSCDSMRDAIGGDEITVTWSVTKPPLDFTIRVFMTGVRRATDVC